MRRITNNVEERRIAVLIDADNVSQKYIKFIFEELSKHGILTYKRIYGDWTSTRQNSWKEVLLNYSITPIQQYGYTTGKNSTDSALIIDAMDILYSENVDGFCIVSSDSDFTRLAVRLREDGMYVVGMGEKKTPNPFIVACEQFKYLESLIQVEAVPNPSTNIATVPNELKEITNLILVLIADMSDEAGWVHLSAIGNMLVKRQPDFDTRNYGYTKLSSLITAIPVVEMKMKGKAYYIRSK
ncbi:MAG TPA: NYN domain-containing protein [Anaerovoracaceae bacterium]|nr:NYN domain-containing protein [Anaerovoracaceae bacterium]